MSKLIFILSGYEPDYSAIGICIKNLINILEHDHEIFVISEKTIFLQFDQVLSKSKLVFVESRMGHIKNLLEFKISKSNRFKKFLYTLFLFLVKVCGFIKAHTSLININENLVRKYRQKILEIIQPNDILIPVCLPFESLLSAVNIKKTIKSIKVYPILFDKFSENFILHRTTLNYLLKREEHLKLEEKVFDLCDGVFHTNSWSNHLKKFHESLSPNKLYLIEHPLLKRIQSNIPLNKERKYISITYTGALYRKIRSPKFIIKLFNKLQKINKGIKLEFFSKGNCNSYIKKQLKNNNSIIFHGQVTKDIANNAILESDILLSIGNTDISQLPSKIFEYISTGKPIIHTFKDPKDQIINLLSKYKFALVINELEEIDDNLLNKFIDFAHNIKHIPYNVVENLYTEATPSYVANQIMNVIWR